MVSDDPEVLDDRELSRSPVRFARVFRILIVSPIVRPDFQRSASFASFSESTSLI